MKSPLEKLKKVGLNKSEPKENWDNLTSMHVDGLIQAAKDLKDMRTCYDSLLSAAAAAANSAYEFSESLSEMGNWLLEKTATLDDGESGGALSMLGKLQLELQKLVDTYRSQIIMTITNPSESLLNELRKVEEMKLQCDEKREIFEFMAGQLKEKGKSRHGKGETFSSQQLQAVREEYDEVARFCIFRVESLKQGQSRSLLTQAARHHAAQINFFRKGLQSLEAVEPHIKHVSERQHIDYELCELNEGEEGEKGIGVQSNVSRESSFDYRQNTNDEDNTYASRNSMELDQLASQSGQTSNVRDVEVQMNIRKIQEEQILGQQLRVGSHSAPIFVEKFEPSDRTREIRTAVHKLSSHVLPTPADAKGSIADTSTVMESTTTPVGSKNMWHSSPLDVGKQKKIIEDHFSVTSFSKSQIVALEDGSNKHFLPLPPSVAVPQLDTQTGLEVRNVKRQAFSGPLASKSSSSKQLSPTSGPICSSEPSQSSVGLLSRVSGHQTPSAPNPTHNSNISPAIVSSSSLNELHELPRPPDSLILKPTWSVGAPGHSAPLVNRNQEVAVSNRNSRRQSKEGSPLPLPQLSVSRSFSIPSRSSQRTMVLHSGKLLASSQIVQSTEVASPPLTPISLTNMKSTNPRQTKGNMSSVIVGISSG